MLAKRLPMKTSFLIFVSLLVFSFTAYAQTATDRDKGIEVYRQGEYEKAAQILQESVKLEKKDRLAWLYLGASLVKLKKDSEAAKAFRKTNVVYKKNVPVYERPLKIISKPPVAYTEAARRNQVSGNIKVAVEFGADGKIGFAFPFQDLPDGLTANAINAAKSIKFEPAVKDGKSITVVSVIEYSFSRF